MPQFCAISYVILETYQERGCVQ